MDMLDRFVAIYINDILIYSNTKKEHIKHVKKVLQRLRELGLRVDVRKSEFNINEVKFLGLVITKGGVKMDPSKVSTILEWETPRDVKGYRRFLGFVNYYRRFIKDFSQLTRPINNLLKNNTTEQWDERCDKSFNDIKA